MEAVVVLVVFSVITVLEEVEVEFEVEVRRSWWWQKTKMALRRSSRWQEY